MSRSLYAYPVMRHTLRSVTPCLALLAVLLLSAGCGSGGGSAQEGPPEGWQANGTRWWTDGVDTTRAFRDLSSVRAMGVVEGTPVLSASESMTDEQMTYAVKQEFEKLYRKAPEIIDSLFAEHVASKVQQVEGGADVRERVQSFSDENSRLLETNYFRTPTRTRTLGQDIPMTYPDSLFDQGVGGRVRMQVYIDDEGNPQAIKLLGDGVHPVLDDIAQRAMTQMRWDPARVKKGYGWQPVPSWTWANVNFSSTPS